MEQIYIMESSIFYGCYTLESGLAKKNFHKYEAKNSRIPETTQSIKSLQMTEQIPPHGLTMKAWKLKR